MKKLSLKLAVVVALAVMTCTTASAANQPVHRSNHRWTVERPEMCSSADARFRFSRRKRGPDVSGHLFAKPHCDILNTVGSLLEALLGSERGARSSLPLPQTSQQQVGAGLSDTAP